MATQMLNSAQQRRAAKEAEELAKEQKNRLRAIKRLPMFAFVNSIQNAKTVDEMIKALEDYRNHVQSRINKGMTVGQVQPIAAKCRAESKSLQRIRA